MIPILVDVKITLLILETNALVAHELMHSMLFTSKLF